MTTTPVQPDNASDPRAMGAVAKMLSRVMGRMTPDDRTAMMQDAAALSATELGKAAEIVKTDNMGTVDSAHSGFIEDRWSDGANEMPPVAHVHGPGSSVPSGSLNAGPPQQASGNGAVPMERQYSRFAPQVGNTETTTRLGRELVAMRGAMKSMVEAMHGLNTQVEILKAGMAEPSSVITDAVAKAVDLAVGKALDAAVAKAMAPIKASLMAKADKKDDEWKDDDEDAKAAALLAKADDDKKKKDREAEDDDDSETAKAASELRVMANTHVDHARLRISKALDYVAESKPKAAQRAMTLAQANIAKAEALVTEAQALREGKAGLSTQLLQQGIAKAKKGITASVALNQDIWPNTGDTDVGKGNPPAPVAAAVAVPPADLAKAMEQIQAAASGMGMLQASVSDMMNALTAKTQASTTVEGERTNLPPVFALAKAGASDLSSREAELSRLRDTNIITFDDFDRARDTLMRVRMNMPADTIQAMVDRLPDAARAVLTRGAA